jgi:hypothetical protein
VTKVAKKRRSGRTYLNFEKRHEQLLSRSEFSKRMLHHAFLGIMILAIALGIGVLGYHYFTGEPWVDALVDASMILGGMGPVGELKNDGAKVFASCYALFSGLAFIGIASIILAPFAHRVLHKFHIDEQDG